MSDFPLGRLTSEERELWFDEARKPSPWEGYAVEHKENADRLRRALKEVDALWHLVLNLIPEEDQETFRLYNKTFLPEHPPTQQNPPAQPRPPVDVPAPSVEIRKDSDGWKK